MITDVRTLIELCSNELSYRGYTTWNANCYKKHWNQLDEWMKARQISDFSKVMADRYLDENIGTHLLSRGMAERDKRHLRAIRMLISFLCKDLHKKELIGRYKNNGSEWTLSGQPIKVKDHDFEGPGGKDCPYGIYDLNFNEGFVNVGISADTAEFAVNSIREWCPSLALAHS